MTVEKAPLSEMLPYHPNLVSDINDNFIAIIDEAIQLQIKIDPTASVFKTFSEVIPKYIPYISKNINKRYYNGVRNVISNKFYNHISYWKQYKNTLPFIFSTRRMNDKRVTPLITKKTSKKSTSIIENFLDNTIEVIDEPITTTQDDSCITIQKGNAIFRVHSGVRTIEFEGMTLTF